MASFIHLSDGIRQGSAEGSEVDTQLRGNARRHATVNASDGRAINAQSVAGGLRRSLRI
jgi:hypothetical protein